MGPVKGWNLPDKMADLVFSNAATAEAGFATREFDDLGLFIAKHSPLPTPNLVL